MKTLAAVHPKRTTIHLIILLFALSLLSVSTGVLAKGQAYVPPQSQQCQCDCPCK